MAFTLRNWGIGHHIYEYEQAGEDRAEYGEQVLKKLAERLKKMEIKGMSPSNLYHYKQFYEAYPQIFQTVSGKFQLSENQANRILQTLSVKFEGLPMIPGNKLIGQLSFSHFLELMRCEPLSKRIFYETESLNNNWSVRELQRAIDSMLYERTGLSKEKKSVLESMSKRTLKPEEIFRNPYMLEFLGLDEKHSYTETNLEEAIINHLQKFLLELGYGFCFEAQPAH